MHIHEINKEIWLETPKGEGIAHFLIDYGPESDLKWVVFLSKTGQCWTFNNDEVRAAKNVTLGRKSPEKPFSSEILSSLNNRTVSEIKKHTLPADVEN